MKIFSGDCLEILPTLEENSVDMVLTDLPYGTTSCAWDVIIPFEQMWKELYRVAKDNAAFVFTASQPFTSMLVMSNLKAFRHEWIWQKNRGSNFANTVREPMKEHESVLVFSKGKWTYNKQMQERAEGGKARAEYKVKFASKSENYREFEGRDAQNLSELRVPSSVQKFNTEVGLHPTQKPVALFEYLIKTYSNQGDTVLDICAGSGTTGVACENLKRDYILIEKEEKYIKVIRERLKQVKMKKRLF